MVILAFWTDFMAFHSKMEAVLSKTFQGLLVQHDSSRNNVARCEKTLQKYKIRPGFAQNSTNLDLLPACKVIEANGCKNQTDFTAH